MTTYRELTGVGVPTRAAAVLVGVPRATATRRPRTGGLARRPVPVNKLSDVERAEVLAVVNSPRFVDLPPIQIYANLLDEGVYLGSISTIYRIDRQRAGQGTPPPGPAPGPRHPRARRHRTRAGRPDAAPPVMAAGPAGGLAPASTTTPCPARTIGTPADAGADRYVISGDLPAALDLQQAWSVVGGCLDAHAAATLLQLSPDGSTVRKALTVWGPDAFSPFSPDAAPTATDVVVGDRPARLLDRGWGAAIGWSDDRGSWVITASGITSTVVRQAAETVHAAGPAADLAALLPGLASVPLGAPSTDRVVWYASYGDDHGQTPISLSVSSDMPPWQALASTSKPGGALVDVGGAPAVVGGGSTASFVSWQVAPGVQAQLFGDASDMPGGILALANRVAAVSADDPRLIGSRPAQSPASSGVER